MERSTALVSLLFHLLVLSITVSGRKYLGSLTQHAHGISGEVFMVNEQMLRILGFEYDGEAPDAHFLIGTEGSEPSEDGTIIPYPFDGTFYDFGDEDAPELNGTLDGVNLELTLPATINVSDMKWLSVWCRQMKANLADLVLDSADKTTEQTMSEKTMTEKTMTEKTDIYDYIDYYDDAPGNPSMPRGNLIGDFNTYQHGVAGQVYAVDEQTLRIENFEYDGKGPDAYFIAGIKGSKPGAPGQRACLLSHKFNGLFYNFNAKGAPKLKDNYKGANITLTLPRKCVVSKLKWVSVWCRKFKANFGDLIADFTLDNPEEDSRPRDSSTKRLIGNFTSKKFNNCAGPRGGQQCNHGVSGQVFGLDEQTLMIKGFTYNNKGRCETDTFFLAGISGDRPPTNKKTAAGKGILLTFDGTFYSYGDSTAPGIAESFDEGDIILKVPLSTQVSNLKWLSVWCRRYNLNFGDVVADFSLDN